MSRTAPHPDPEIAAAQDALRDFVRRLAIRMADRDHDAEEAARFAAEQQGTGDDPNRPARYRP